MEGLGNVHDQSPAASHHARVLDQQRARITEVLEQSLVEDDLEGAVAKRHRQRVGFHQEDRNAVSLGEPTHDRERGRRVVEHHRDGARARQSEAVATGSRSDLEHGAACHRAVRQNLARQPVAGRVRRLDVADAAPVRFPVLQGGRARQRYSPHCRRSARKRGSPASRMRRIAPATPYSSRT